MAAGKGSIAEGGAARSAALSTALQIHLLTEISRVFSAPGSVRGIFERLAGLLAGNLRAQAVLLLLREGDESGWGVIAARGAPAGRTRGEVVPEADPLLAPVAASGRPLVAEDLARDRRWRRSRLKGLCPARCGSLLALPLVVHGLVRGFMVLAAPAGSQRCSESDMEWFMPVAEQVSLALEKALLTVELRKAGRTLEATVCERTRALHVANRALRTTIAEVRDLRRYSEQVIAGLGSGIVTFDASGTVSTVNPQARAMLRLGDAPVEGRRLSEVFGESFARGLLAKLARRRIQISRAQTAVVLGSGEERFIGYSVTPLRLGRRASWILQFRDITDSKRLERDLRRLERLVSLGEISANVAHELKNPLTVMYANMEWLLEKVPEECRRRVQITIDHMERMEGIIQRMGTLSKDQPLAARPIDFGDLVSQMLAFVDKTLREKKIAAAVAVPQTQIWIQGDPAQLQQVLLNLVMNAAQAIGSDGTVGVRLERRASAGQPGVELSVTDSGPGIPAHLLGKIFEPFFTTKETGTGLGLAITSQIVAAHGGRVRAENNPAGGACVSVWLPISQRPGG